MSDTNAAILHRWQVANTCAVDQSWVSVSCQSSRLRLFLYHQITDSSQTDQKHVNKHQREENHLKWQTFILYLRFILLVWSMSHLLTWRRRFKTEPPGGDSVKTPNEITSARWQRLNLGNFWLHSWYWEEVETRRPSLFTVDCLITFPVVLTSLQMLWGS